MSNCYSICRTVIERWCYMIKVVSVIINACVLLLFVPEYSYVLFWFLVFGSYTYHSILFLHSWVIWIKLWNIMFVCCLSVSTLMCYWTSLDIQGNCSNNAWQLIISLPKLNKIISISVHCLQKPVLWNKTRLYKHKSHYVLTYVKKVFFKTLMSVIKCSRFSLFIISQIL